MTDARKAAVRVRRELPRMVEIRVASLCRTVAVYLALATVLGLAADVARPFGDCRGHEANVRMGHPR